jgi:hypothetical protein
MINLSHRFLIILKKITCEMREGSVWCGTGTMGPVLARLLRVSAADAERYRDPPYCIVYPPSTMAGRGTMPDRYPRGWIKRVPDIRERRSISSRCGRRNGRSFFVSANGRNR